MFMIGEKELRKNKQQMLKKQRIRGDELQCAACGFIGNNKDFYNSSVHNKFKICPKCGTVRFVCEENKGYIRS